ncbi:hypothetical protein MAR_002201 [Mya arenaria]|uniref:Uncharacterized protein n=1 Tax=Mya arenaria TaxID=6604 RepID=A0ABY7FI44_MYAAR|nr:hypothetical protein MAR_002201 [Mya arenaria]
MASKQIQCEMCCNENAVGHCKTCGYVGETCVNIHTRGKMFQTHIVIMLEAVKIDEDGTDTPKVILWDITEEICKQHPTERAFFLCNIHDSMICDEAEQSIEICKKNADRCMQECMELGNKIKLRVDELTSDIIHGITKTNDINVSTHSSITQTCNEKTKWCGDEENKIDDFVDNNMAGHLYLMHKHFEKEASDTRSQLIDFKHKHTFKGFDFKENNVILKCLFEDLEEVCEQQEEVTGSDDGSANDVFASTPKINKTRRELNVLLNQAKHELDNSEKEGAVVKAQFSQIKDNIKWTQPTGTVKIDISVESGWQIINLVFTFPDGTQTTKTSVILIEKQDVLKSSTKSI